MKYLTAIIFTLINHHAMAGEITGKVSRLLTNDAGLHWVYITGTVSNKPACSLWSGFAIKDENSSYGKAQFSMLLTAFASGKEVKVTGANTCTRNSAQEDISKLELFAQ